MQTQTKQLSISEAVAALPGLSTSKFVGSVDVDIVLELTDKQRKESLSGSVVLPNQFGEEKKVIVVAEEKDAKLAKAAGAVDAGADDLLKKIEDGSVAYDIVIATPMMMPKLAKLGKVLGPKGLMPNPNNGTVTDDVETGVKSFKSGKINFKMSDQGAIRGKVAKLDLSPEQVIENLTAYLKAVFVGARKFNQRPFRKVTISPTMGAGVQLDLNSLYEMLS